jgi:hypothetical protein
LKEVDALPTAHFGMPQATWGGQHCGGTLHDSSWISPSSVVIGGKIHVSWVSCLSILGPRSHKQPLIMFIQFWEWPTLAAKVLVAVHNTAFCQSRVGMCVVKQIIE